LFLHLRRSCGDGSRRLLLFFDPLCGFGRVRAPPDHANNHRQNHQNGNEDPQVKFGRKLSAVFSGRCRAGSNGIESCPDIGESEPARGVGF
jgi:hypothetical protein